MLRACALYRRRGLGAGPGPRSTWAGPRLPRFSDALVPGRSGDRLPVQAGLRLVLRAHAPGAEARGRRGRARVLRPRGGKRSPTGEKAIQLDPDYAYAHAVLSNWWLNLGYELSGEEQEQAYEKARRAADRALALALDLPAAHRARGYVLSRLDYDQMGALAEYRRALALSPGDGHSMASLAGQLAKVGEVQQSVELMRSAITTDPLRVDWYGALAYDLMVLGRFDEAEEMVKSALRQMQPCRST